MALLKKSIIVLLSFLLLSIPALAENAALNKVPTYAGSWASSFYPTNLPNVVDGNFATVSTANGNAYALTQQGSSDVTYIQIDLTAWYNLTSLTARYGRYVNVGWPSNEGIKVSSDGTNWVTLYTNTTNSGTEDIANVTISLSSNGTNVRYIRFNVWQASLPGNSVWIRWYEIQAEGTLNTPSPYTPTNGSIQYYNYPPQNTNINFTWTAGAAYYNLQIAKDSNFNLLSVDTVVSINYSVQSLQGTQQYWWKVRTYNSASGAYGNWSDTFSFTLQANNTANNGSVQGVVYELINGAQTAVSGASVFIYNTTWSSTQVTGTNGYYLFQNLGNGAYNLQASKTDYQSSALQTVNVSGNVVTQDILIEKCISGFNCFYNQGYVKFVVQNWFGTVKYAGVTTSVYRGSDVTTTYTGTTGTDGTVTFLLKKDQQYRITFIDASQGISESITLVPSDSLYYIIVSDTAVPWWNGTYSETQQIVTTASTHVINTTHAHVNITYADALNQTTALVFYLNQTNHSGINNTQTILQSFSAGAQGNYTQSFIVSGYSGQSYLVNVRATHTTFGTVYRSYGVQFPGLQTNADNFIPTKMKAIIALAFMFFIGAVFGEIRAAQGAGIFCILGWVFLGMGWLAYFNSITMGAGLTIATVLAVMWNMNEKKKAEGMT